MVATELLEAGVSAQIGRRGRRGNPDRGTRRNGYRERPWETRVLLSSSAPAEKRAGIDGNPRQSPRIGSIEN